MRKRILIVNCYFDDSHQRIRRTWKIPQPMGPVYLAGALAPGACVIRLYDEVSSGPLEDERLLAWPDMLVLTGLTNSLDRMLHLTAYARTKNPKVVVVAGGPPIRALPRYCKQFFDYPCLGDIEELKDVVEDSFGKRFIAEQMLPRYDLAYWVRRFGYVETTRYCNFRCTFCALTGEGRRYRHYSLDDIRAQIVAMGKRKNLLFIDNNFYGNSRKNFLARLELINEMHETQELPRWAALVTNDFFYKEENLQMVRKAGCISLFSGVESFDPQWLRNVNKQQNTTFPQVKLISRCLDAGIVFLYGLILDVVNRRLSDLRAEIDFITGTPEITLPAFLTLAIPILGTPSFHECLAKRLFLPKTKLRDMDGTTLVLQPLDSIGDVVDFISQIICLRGYRKRVLQHSLGFLRRYRTRFNHFQMLSALANGALLCTNAAATSPSSLVTTHRNALRRTHVTTTEYLDDVYRPAFPVASKFQKYFKPTSLTDRNGGLVEELSEDLTPSTRQTEVAV
jgi:hopanoid C-2 methylase